MREFLVDWVWNPEIGQILHQLAEYSLCPSFQSIFLISICFLRDLEYLNEYSSE